MWFVGGDMMWHIGGHVELKAQWLHGARRRRGRAGRLRPPAARGRLRRARHDADAVVRVPACAASTATRFVWLETERAYLTKVWRAAGGLRWVVLTPRAVLKAEYLHNGEYGGIPQIPDDVFTSSLVLSF